MEIERLIQKSLVYLIKNDCNVLVFEVVGYLVEFNIGHDADIGEIIKMSLIDLESLRVAVLLKHCEAKVIAIDNNKNSLVLTGEVLSEYAT